MLRSTAQGVLMASSTEVSVRDLARRLDSTLEHAPALETRFPSPRSGPGARASWKDRRVAGGGWIGLAASGSASQLASRTVKIALADEVSRWPARVRSGEGHPLALLRARLVDWGDDGRLLAISSPVHPADAIALMFRDGDRRRVEYLCQDCNRRDAVRMGPSDRPRPRRATRGSPACTAAPCTTNARAVACSARASGCRKSRSRPTKDRSRFSSGDSTPRAHRSGRPCRSGAEGRAAAAERGDPRAARDV